MLGKVSAITQGGIGYGADFHGDSLLQNSLFQVWIAVQVEAVAKAVYAAAQGDGYFLVLSAETLSGV